MFCSWCLLHSLEGETQIPNSPFSAALQARTDARPSPATHQRAIPSGEFFSETNSSREPVASSDQRSAAHRATTRASSCPLPAIRKFDDPVILASVSDRIVNNLLRRRKTAPLRTIDCSVILVAGTPSVRPSPNRATCARTATRDADQPHFEDSHRRPFSNIPPATSSDWRTTSDNSPGCPFTCSNPRWQYELH